MIGILVITLLSWLALYYFERKSILVLGFLPLKKRSLQFLIGFVLLVCLFFLNTYIETIVKSICRERKNFDLALLFNSFWYHFKSVLTEELLFRGAILYILIKKIGAQKAIWLSSIAFWDLPLVFFWLMGPANPHALCFYSNRVNGLRLGIFVL